MKRKISKILGIGLIFVLAASLMTFAIPVSADPGENKWSTFVYPVEGAPGSWFYDPDIGAIGPMAEAIDGTLYTAVTTTLGYSAEATSVTYAFYKSNGIDVDITVENGDCAVTWTFDFPVDADPGNGNMGYALVISNDHVRPAFQIHNNDGICGAFPWGTHLYSPWDPTLGGYNGWHTSVAAWSTPVADMDWISATGDRYHDNNPTGVFTVTIDKGQLVPGFYWAVHFGAGGFYDYGGLSQYPVAWVPWSGDASTFVTATIADCHLMKSTDGGRSWSESTSPLKYAGGAVVDMVCSDLFEDVLWVTDGNYVYKSVDGGVTFAFVAAADLEKNLMGACGIEITSKPITCIDVGYDGSDKPVVFIGTRYVIGHVGSVYWIADESFPASWHDLELKCYGCCNANTGTGCYDVYAVGAAPDFANSSKAYVVVTTDDVDCDGTATDPSTRVIYTTGTVCSWNFVAELKCSATPFAISHASRIAFPDDYEDTNTLFVGVVGDGGDVYSVTVGSPGVALDLNVAGATTQTNICSLDIMGDTDDTSLIAGANDDTDVYYSYDGGWNWANSSPPGKSPTGEVLTYALWVGDSALAATSCTECAVSMSCGEEGGKFWNQISLIATDIDAVLYLDHSPGHLSATSKTMFMLTKGTTSNSLFRHDGTYWERVFFLSPVCSNMMVLVSPDFNDTNAVFVANYGGDIWRSMDAGCSWTPLRFPSTATIFSAVVIDEDTVIVGGTGAVYKTTLYGARPWDEYVVTGAGNIMSFAVDGDTILLGDSLSQVFISEDGGETWDLVGDCATVLGGSDTSVVFDPGYAVSGDAGENTIYAAAGNVIARCVIDPALAWSLQTWDTINDETDADFWGIAVAGDTALYVADASTGSGMVRCLNPTAPAGLFEVERITTGLDETTELNGLLVTTGSNVLWAFDLADATNIWTYEDLLATPVISLTPASGALLATTTTATIEWAALDAATMYEVYIYSYCPSCPDNMVLFDDFETALTCNIIDELTPGTTYYWKVRVAEGYPYLSKWSELRTFNTALGSVLELCSPACGAQDVILTTNFSWDAVPGAASYEVEIATNEDFSPAIASGTATVNAWVTDITLDYSTTYYWRVRAVRDGVVGAWSVCIFTTAAEPAEPVEPVSPVDIITEEITPLWIWVIIGLGAALMIAVIVLITKTRRVP